MKSPSKRIAYRSLAEFERAVIAYSWRGSEDSQVERDEIEAEYKAAKKKLHRILKELLDATEKP